MSTKVGNGSSADRLPPHELVQRGLETFHAATADRDALRVELDCRNCDIQLLAQEVEQLRDQLGKASGEADHYKFLYAEAITQINSIASLIDDAKRNIREAPYARTNSAAASLKQQQLDDIDLATRQMAQKLAPPQDLTAER